MIKWSRLGRALLINFVRRGIQVETHHDSYRYRDRVLLKTNPVIDKHVKCYKFVWIFYWVKSLVKTADQILIFR